MIFCSWLICTLFYGYTYRHFLGLLITTFRIPWLLGLLLWFPVNITLHYMVGYCYLSYMWDEARQHLTRTFVWYLHMNDTKFRELRCEDMQLLGT